VARRFDQAACTAKVDELYGRLLDGDLRRRSR
jgi:hypothetical protein